MNGKCFLMAVMLVSARIFSWAQVRPTPTIVNGYSFITGVDASRWVGGVSWQTFHTDYFGVYAQPDAEFVFSNQSYDVFSLSRSGAIYFEWDGVGCQQFPCLNGCNTKAIWGWRNFINSTTAQFYRGNMSFDCIDGRCYYRTTITFKGGAPGYSRYTREWRYIFDDRDNSITMLYGSKSDTSTVAVPIGIQEDTNRFIVIDTRSHTISGTPLDSAAVGGWPGTYRYYKFMPECQLPYDIDTKILSPSEASIILSSDSGFWFGFLLDTVGGQLDTADILWTDKGHMEFANLIGDREYVVTVFSPCLSEGTHPSKTFTFRSPCPSTYNKIDYNVHSPNAECRYGTFGSPSRYEGAIDWGYASRASRHTMHCHADEVDSNTRNMLHTVPQGYGMSVRLGNSYNGAEQEDVTYTLHVDTNDYDLLVLRYALVEQNPNHGPADNPQFTFSVNDSSGNLINTCYFGNFVSGDLSGWNQGAPNVLWKDWTAVGIDLGPLHGQTIQLKLSNYDCAQSGHFGYAYYVLDGSTKHLNSETCGTEYTNTFRAPEGFGYHWYRDGHPEDTLSTADTLLVTEEGGYKCRVHYLMGDTSCGFTLATYCGPRYPHADFTPMPVDTCPMRIRFLNTSVVAYDQEETQLSAYPCDYYEWSFGDGTSSTENNPLHRYSFPGRYQVTLYAFLGHGQCVDTFAMAIDVDVAYYEIVDTLCQGASYLFFNDTLTAPGYYLHNDGCEQYNLQLREMPNYDLEHADTFLLSQGYLCGDTLITQPGHYHVHLQALGGCDSLVTLHLSCLEVYDTVVCEDDFPVVWRGRTYASASHERMELLSRAGTDSLVDFDLKKRMHPVSSPTFEVVCEDSGSFRFALSDTLLYHIASVPADSALPYDIIEGSAFPEGWYYSPADSALLIFRTDYIDQPSCPASDTVALARVVPVRIDLEVTPDAVDDTHKEIRAVDHGDSTWLREWYVNNIQQGCYGNVLNCYAPLSEDSVRLMLVASNQNCSDTARAVIPILSGCVYFPNIFTPDAPTNNTFRGYGSNICDYRLEIYTKWGDCYFRSDDINEVWDGTQNGRRCPASAYVYVCHYTPPDGRTRTQVGTVLLTR